MTSLEYVVDPIHTTNDTEVKGFTGIEVNGVCFKNLSEVLRYMDKLRDENNTLEKRCANYEMTISKMEKGTCDICKETEKDKKIEALEQQIEKMKCCANCAFDNLEPPEVTANGVCENCINHSKWEL